MISRRVDRAAEPRDVLDGRTGETLHRIAPWFFSGGTDRMSWIGGAGTREWWGEGGHALLIDIAEGTRIATDADMVSANPVLRGKLGWIGNSFRADDAGTLLARGGDGQRYAIDIATLKATRSEGPLPDSQYLPDYWANKGSLERVTLERRDGALLLTCFTTDSGPCGAEWRDPTGKARWKLTAADLDGDSILTVEAVDEVTAYLYVADDRLVGMLFGGVYLYAVDLATGKVRWHRKL